MPPSVPDTAMSVSRPSARASPASASAACSRSTTSARSPMAACSRSRSAPADTPGFAITPMASTGGWPDSRAARRRRGTGPSGRLAARARHAGHAVGAAAARAGQPQPAPGRTPRRASATTSSAPRGARPDVSTDGVSRALDQPCARTSARAARRGPGGRLVRDVAHRGGDAVDGGGALDEARVEPRARDGVDAAEVTAELDGRVGAQHRVGGREAAGARGLERGGQDRAGRRREGDGQQDRGERAGERAPALAEGLPGDAEHVSPPDRSGARRRPRRWERGARPPAVRRP